MSQTYVAYMDSPTWHALRRDILRRDTFTCQDCGAKRVPLDVHHMTYARFEHEDPTDLISLCRACHDWRHSYWWTKVPGGAPDGRDFAFDYAGPQTEWRREHWHPARADAWAADAKMQQEYANALLRVKRRPVSGRPVRAVGRLEAPAATSVKPSRTHRMATIILAIVMLYILMVVAANVLRWAF